MFEYLRWMASSLCRHVVDAFFSVCFAVIDAIYFVIDRVPFWLQPGLYWFLLTFPIRAVLAGWQERKWRHLILGLPVILSLLPLLWLVVWYNGHQFTLEEHEWSEAKKAVAAENLEQAERLLFRILHRNERHAEDARFVLAVMYQEAGERDRAELLFQALAPDTRRGLPKAHGRLAILLCESLDASSPQSEIERARHHLEVATGSDEYSSPDLLLARGRYHLAVGELEEARSCLTKISSVFPEVYYPLGRIYRALGNQEPAKRNFLQAKDFLRDQLEDDPTSRESRENYADVLINIGEMGEAREVLETGREIDPDGNWNMLLARLSVLIHDVLAVEGGHDVSELFSPLAQALDYDPNFLPALMRLMSYVSANPDENTSLRSILSRVVAEAKEPALAHLALGNVCWVEKDPKAALFHFERSVAINNKLTVVLNNLAWLLAHDEQNPDLERALALVTTALEEDPKNKRFMDTRGTVLMKLERWKEALEDLEAAVGGVPNPAATHARLAVVYEQLGHPEIAREHRALEQELTNAAVSQVGSRNLD